MDTKNDEIKTEKTENENIVELSAPKKKRGRPAAAKLIEQEVGKDTAAPAKKTSARRSKKKLFNDEDKSNLCKQIQGVHLITAKMTGIPELFIDENEAAMLADSVVNIAEEYGLAMSGKMGAWAQLLGTAAFIYGPKMFAVKKRVAEQAQLNDAA